MHEKRPICHKVKYAQISLVISYKARGKSPSMVDFITSGRMDADYSLMSSYYKGIREKSQRIKEKFR